MIIKFLLGLSIIVGIHELGHLLFAKLFGMRVESYIIGFPPKLLRFQWKETEYAIGAVPLGGAVKISGMIDESMDTNSLSQAPQPWEFRSKPAWQRLIVVLGGIFFNIISAILIYTIITFVFGSTYLSREEVNKHGIVPNALGISLGFQEEDRIININGKSFENFNDALKPATLLANNGYYMVERRARKAPVRIDIPANLIEQLADSHEQTPLIAPCLPFAVKQVAPNSAAAQAGLQAGDQLVAVAGMPTPYFHQLQAALAAHAGQKVTICYKRAGQENTTHATISSTGKLGFQPEILLTYSQRNYSLSQSIFVASRKSYEIMKTNLQGLGRILTGKISASKSLSGPVGIVQVFGKTFNGVQFWSVIAFISLTIALTNLLPIPALDGGHAVWLLYEIITGHKLSDNFLETVQRVGMILLLLLIGYTTFNDLYKLLLAYFA